MSLIVSNKDFIVNNSLIPALEEASEITTEKTYSDRKARLVQNILKQLIDQHTFNNKLKIDFSKVICPTPVEISSKNIPQQFWDYFNNEITYSYSVCDKVLEETMDLLRSTFSGNFSHLENLNIFEEKIKNVNFTAKVSFRQIADDFLKKHPEIPFWEIHGSAAAYLATNIENWAHFFLQNFFKANNIKNQEEILLDKLPLRPEIDLRVFLNTSDENLLSYNKKFLLHFASYFVKIDPANEFYYLALFQFLVLKVDRVFPNSLLGNDLQQLDVLFINRLPEKRLFSTDYITFIYKEGKISHYVLKENLLEIYQGMLNYLFKINHVVDELANDKGFARINFQMSTGMIFPVEKDYQIFFQNALKGRGVDYVFSDFFLKHYPKHPALKLAFFCNLYLYSPIPIDQFKALFSKNKQSLVENFYETHFIYLINFFENNPKNKSLLIDILTFLFYFYKKWEGSVRELLSRQYLTISFGNIGSITIPYRPEKAFQNLCQMSLSEFQSFSDFFKNNTEIEFLDLNIVDKDILLNLFESLLDKLDKSYFKIFLREIYCNHPIPFIQLIGQRCLEENKDPLIELIILYSQESKYNLKAIRLFSQLHPDSQKRVLPSFFDNLLYHHLALAINFTIKYLDLFDQKMIMKTFKFFSSQSFENTRNFFKLINALCDNNQLENGELEKLFSDYLWLLKGIISVDPVQFSSFIENLEKQALLTPELLSELKNYSRTEIINHLNTPLQKVVEIFCQNPDCSLTPEILEKIFNEGIQNFRKIYQLSPLAAIQLTCNFQKNNYFVSVHYLYIFNQLNHSQDDDVYHLFLDLNLLIPEPEPVLMQKEFLFVKFFKCSSSKTLELLKRILLKCIIDKQKFENILLDVFFYYLEDEASSVKEELLQIVLKENLFTQNLHFKTKLQQNSKHLESLNGIIQKEFIQLVVCQKISLIIEFYFKILPILTKKNLTKFFWEITKIISKYDQDELVVFVKEFFEKNYTVQLSTKQWNQLCHDLLKHCLPHKAADCLFFLTLQETYTILKNSEEYFLNILKYLNFLERDRRTFFVLRVIHLLDSPTRAHEIDFFFFLQNHLQWLMNNDPTIIQANDVEKILEVLNAKNKFTLAVNCADVIKQINPKLIHKSKIYILASFEKISNLMIDFELLFKNYQIFKGFFSKNEISNDHLKIYHSFFHSLIVCSQDLKQLYLVINEFLWVKKEFILLLENSAFFEHEMGIIENILSKNFIFDQNFINSLLDIYTDLLKKTVGFYEKRGDQQKYNNEKINSFLKFSLSKNYELNFYMLIDLLSKTCWNDLAIFNQLFSYSLQRNFVWNKLIMSKISEPFFNNESKIENFQEILSYCKILLRLDMDELFLMNTLKKIGIFLSVNSQNNIYPKNKVADVFDEILELFVSKITDNYLDQTLEDSWIAQLKILYFIKIYEKSTLNPSLKYYKFLTSHLSTWLQDYSEKLFQVFTKGTSSLLEKVIMQRSIYKEKEGFYLDKLINHCIIYQSQVDVIEIIHLCTKHMDLPVAVQANQLLMNYLENKDLKLTTKQKIIIGLYFSILKKLCPDLLREWQNYKHLHRHLSVQQANKLFIDLCKQSKKKKDLDFAFQYMEKYTGELIQANSFDFHFWFTALFNQAEEKKDTQLYQHLMGFFIKACVYPFVKQYLKVFVDYQSFESEFTYQHFSLYLEGLKHEPSDSLESNSNEENFEVFEQAQQLLMRYSHLKTKSLIHFSENLKNLAEENPYQLNRFYENNYKQCFLLLRLCQSVNKNLFKQLQVQIVNSLVNYKTKNGDLNQQILMFVIHQLQFSPLNFDSSFFKKFIFDRRLLDTRYIPNHNFYLVQAIHLMESNQVIKDDPYLKNCLMNLKKLTYDTCYLDEEYFCNFLFLESFPLDLKIYHFTSLMKFLPVNIINNFLKKFIDLITVNNNLSEVEAFEKMDPLVFVGLGFIPQITTLHFDYLDTLKSLINYIFKKCVKNNDKILFSMSYKIILEWLRKDFFNEEKFIPSNSTEDGQKPFQLLIESIEEFIKMYPRFGRENKHLDMEIFWDNVQAKVSPSRQSQISFLISQWSLKIKKRT